MEAEVKSSDSSADGMNQLNIGELEANKISEKQIIDPMVIPEILSTVLQNYSYEVQDLKSCRLVCKAWNTVVKAKFRAKSCVTLKDDQEMSNLMEDLKGTLYFPFGSLVISCRLLPHITFQYFFMTYGEHLHTISIQPDNTLPTPTSGNPNLYHAQLQFIYGRLLELLKCAPNLRNVNVGAITVDGLHEHRNLEPYDHNQNQSLNYVKAVKRLHLEVPLQRSGFEFSEKVLLQASNVEELSLIAGPLPARWQVQLTVDSPILVAFGRRLANQVSRGKIQNLKLEQIHPVFLVELGILPELKVFQMNNSLIKEEIGIHHLYSFLEANSDRLKRLVLKNVSRIRGPYALLPLLPNLKSLVFEQPGKFSLAFSVQQEQVPAVVKIKTTYRSLVQGGVKGFFESVKAVEIYEEENPVGQIMYDSLVQLLARRFPNLTTLRFVEVYNKEMSQIFQCLPQLEDLTITCYYQLREEVLTGISWDDAKRIYEMYLCDKYTAEDIYDAALPHLGAVKKYNGCLRDMKRLKKFRISVENWPGRTIMSEACIYLTFLLMKPFEVLTFQNIELPPRGKFMIEEECVPKIYQKFDEEPGFNSDFD